jgi:arylformamidase
MTPAALERAYSPSSCIGGDIDPLIELYERQSAEARESCRTREDLHYGPGACECLDLFLPDGDRPAPLHVFLHGGYWQELSHKQSAVMARGLTARGLALAVVNYTLAPDASLFQMVDECARSLDWLAAEAGDLGVDAQSISLSGHSAGAHLAASLLCGVSGATAPPLVGALLISGIYDLEPIRHTDINEPLGLTEADARALSPMFMPAALTCPVHVLVGEVETGEFHRQSRAFADHLATQNIAVRHDVASGLNHFDIICSKTVVDAALALHAL